MAVIRSILRDVAELAVLTLFILTVMVWAVALGA